MSFYFILKSYSDRVTFKNMQKNYEHTTTNFYFNLIMLLLRVYFYLNAIIVQNCIHIFANLQIIVFYFKYNGIEIFSLTKENIFYQQV